MNVELATLKTPKTVVCPEEIVRAVEYDFDPLNVTTLLAFNPFVVSVAANELFPPNGVALFASEDLSLH
jgi:hypothetical protein